MINNNFLQEGISPSYFFQYVDTLTNLNLHSLVIYKDNKLLSKVHIAPYNEDEKQILFSVSKSFTAVAMMFALQDKLFTLDTTIYSLLKHKLNFEPTEDIKSITIHHLLSMTYGFIDKEGGFVIAPVYQKGIHLGSKLFVVSEKVSENSDKLKYGVINQNEDVVYPFTLDEIPSFTEIILFLLKQRKPLKEWLRL